jgi:hypothetical protein
MPVILGAFNLGLVALFRLEGDAYYREHMVKRLRQPARYAVTHPVEAVKRLFR